MRMLREYYTYITGIKIMSNDISNAFSYNID